MLLLVCWTFAIAQLPQTITIHMDDAFNRHDTIYIGTNFSATFCSDVALGEVPSFQLPPAPPGLRIVLSPPRAGSCWNTLGSEYRYRTIFGQAIDLRPVIGGTQIDTFIIHTYDPGTLSWSDFGTAYLGSVRLTDGAVNGLNLDMKQTNTFDNSGYDGVKLYIIAQQQSVGSGAPNLTEFGAIIAVLAVGIAGVWLIRKRSRNQLPSLS